MSGTTAAHICSSTFGQISRVLRNTRALKHSEYEIFGCLRSARCLHRTHSAGVLQFIVASEQLARSCHSPSLWNHRMISAAIFGQETFINISNARSQAEAVGVTGNAILLNSEPPSKGEKGLMSLPSVWVRLPACRA